MIVSHVVVLILLITAVTYTIRALRAAGRTTSGPRPFSLTGRHYKSFYSRRTFLRLGGTSLIAFALAHTGADEAVDRWHTSVVRGQRSDAIAAGWKGFGEPFWFMTWGAFALLDGLVATHPVLSWGRRNFESMIVGLPVLWSLQRLGGASRPSEDQGAAWRPIKDDNTASGHAFMAAIPWLNLNQTLDRTWTKRLAWTLSWGTGWSRMNDRKHFVSQVVYGHAIAEQAVSSVTSTD
jgi:membrane-associated phospholipid phosphatase